jgi:hypothetical protein
MQAINVSCYTQLMSSFFPLCVFITPDFAWIARAHTLIYILDFKRMVHNHICSGQAGPNKARCKKKTRHRASSLFGTFLRPRFGPAIGPKSSAQVRPTRMVGLTQARKFWAGPTRPGFPWLGISTPCRTIIGQQMYGK